VASFSPRMYKFGGQLVTCLALGSQVCPQPQCILLFPMCSRCNTLCAIASAKLLGCDMQDKQLTVWLGRQRPVLIGCRFFKNVRLYHRLHCRPSMFASLKHSVAVHSMVA
jgi:hypothetical protein